jgi:large subunit ribosomal protein L24
MNKITKSHIKIGDKVKIISGSQKGFIGKIEKIFRNKSILFIEGLSPRIKYIKNKQGGEPKKVEISLAIHISNVMLWDNQSNLSSRIGYKYLENQKKRYFKKSGNIL